MLENWRNKFDCLLYEMLFIRTLKPNLTCNQTLFVRKYFYNLLTLLCQFSRHIALRTFARKFSNIDCFLQILPLKDDALVMSEMQKNGGSPTSFERTCPEEHPKSEKIRLL